MLLSGNPQVNTHKGDDDNRLKQIHPDALGAMETCTAQPATKSSMLVKTQMNTEWKNLRDEKCLCEMPSGYQNQQQYAM